MSFSRTPRNAVVAITLAVSPMAASVAGTPDRVDSTATFLNHARLQHWLADGDRGLWLQAVDLRWFYARFAQPCHGLSATNSLSFETAKWDRIDSRSAVTVPGSARCTMLSFVASKGPPKSRNAKVELQPQAQ